MSAHSRIGAAEKAISTAYTRASWRDADLTHEAAVELESRGLLADRKVVEGEVRQQLASEIGSSIAAHTCEFPGLPLFRAGMREALRIVLGEDPLAVDGSPGDLFDPADSAGGA